MKKHISIIAVGCALCIAAVGAFTGCSNGNKSSEPAEALTTDETEQAETSTQGEVMVQRIPITADNAKLQSRTVMKDDVLWLVQSGSAKPVVPAEKAPLTIEFIGDSITCGYGVESKSPSDPFTTATENFSKSFAYLAAKSLGADYTTCCYSGYGIVSGYSGDGTKNDKELLPDCYGKSSIYKDYGSDWEFSEDCDVVVINLGTNDMNYVAADSDANGSEFVEGYKAFLKTVREKRPEAHIICTVGTMGGDDIYELIERAVSEFGDEKITAYFSQTQSMRDGMGADGHPSKRTHQNSADILAEKIRNTLGE